MTMMDLPTRTLENRSPVKIMKTLLYCSLLLLVVIPTSARAQIEAGGAIQISIQGVPSGEQARINGGYPVSEKGFITM